MKYTTILAVAFATIGVEAVPQAPASACPPSPKGRGGPVKFGPAPTGCSDFEIIVGELFLFAVVSSLARSSRENC
jgi:hypothetical protein